MQQKTYQNKMDNVSALDLHLTYRPKTCQLHYRSNPLKIIKAERQYLYDDMDVKYLDCVNNVSHVGHCHPLVTHAATNQMMKCTVSTDIYTIEDAITQQYTEVLRETLPPDLDVFYFTNSGSEAVDLAVSLAQSYTGNSDIITVDGSFHGSFGDSAYISPRVIKKCKLEKPDWVHVIPLPDTYRGIHRDSDPVAGNKYITETVRIIQRANASGRKIAAFITEPIFSLQGIIVPPRGWIASIASAVREIGGLLIIDEVNTGLGRCGDNFWCHQIDVHTGVVPDVLIIGKSVGNGYPMSIVVTTSKVASRFPNNRNVVSYSGNPTASAVGMAVLQIMKTKCLVQSAKTVGQILHQGFKDLMEKHENIGDVRGWGMSIGIEMVVDRKSRKPDPFLAEEILYRLKNEHHIVVGLQGQFDNVFMLLPPLCFTEENAVSLIAAFDHILMSVKNTAGYDIPLSVITGEIRALGEVNEDQSYPRESRPSRYSDMD